MNTIGSGYLKYFYMDNDSFYDTHGYYEVIDNKKIRHKRLRRYYLTKLCLLGSIENYSALPYLIFKLPHHGFVSLRSSDMHNAIEFRTALCFRFDIFFSQSIICDSLKKYDVE